LVALMGKVRLEAQARLAPPSRPPSSHSRRIPFFLQHFELTSTSYAIAILQGRILYTQRDPLNALRLFQRILQLNPQSLPDPRIGIGLCFWVLNSKEKAKAAWKRSLSLVSLPSFSLSLQSDEGETRQEER